MRRGFTLIELLATAALSALLMVAGFSVIASMGRTRAALARAEAARTFAPELLDMVRQDLINARYYRAAPNELTLTGYSGLDAATLAPTHRPVAVRYRLQSAAGATWMVREQTNLDAANNHNRWTAIVCPGIASFEVMTAPRAGKRAAIDSRVDRTSRVTASGWEGPAIGLDLPEGQREIPDSIRFLARAAAGGPAVDELIRIR